MIKYFVQYIFKKMSSFYFQNVFLHAKWKPEWDGIAGFRGLKIYHACTPTPIPAIIEILPY